MMKDLKFYFLALAVFFAFISGIYLGGKITFGAMEFLREENKGLKKQAAGFQQEIKTRDLLDKMIECESGGVHHGRWGDGGKSYGILQYQRPTFNKLKKKAGMAWLDYWNKEDQIVLAKWALQNGYGHHWTCYKILAKREC